MAFYCVTDIKKRTYTKQGADSLLLAVCALFFCLIQHHKSKAFQKTHKILVLTCGYIKFRKEKPTHDCFTLNTSVSSSDLNGHIQLWQITDSLQILQIKIRFCFKTQSYLNILLFPTYYDIPSFCMRKIFNNNKFTLMYSFRMTTDINFFS